MRYLLMCQASWVIVQMPADLRERSSGVCHGTRVSWSVVTRFLTQSAACLLGISLRSPVGLAFAPMGRSVLSLTTGQKA
jgi:hypothetical protein